MALARHYHRLMTFRQEGLRKYGARLYYQIYGPRPRVSLPTVTRREPAFQSVRVGPVFVGDRPPVVHFVDRVFSEAGDRLTVVEIGPGRGNLCTYVKRRYAPKTASYYGIELDPDVGGPYERVDSVEHVPAPIDVAIASEVAEHMLADQFVDEYLQPLVRRMAARGRLLISVPNPIVPGGIARDYSHVQSWPWYDMYAVLRLFFDEVDVARTHYLADPKRLAVFPLRFILAHCQETDWCEGLVFTTRGPQRHGIAAVR